MILYLVRHAYAGQHGDPRYPDDALRPLTDEGRRDFRRLVKKLARRGFAPEIVGTSPLVRCRQTADEICERIEPAPALIELDALRPSSLLDALISWSNAEAKESVAWVGHAPDVDEMGSQLLGAAETAVSFAKGAVAAIEFADKIISGQGQLRWLVTPKLFVKAKH